jgi:Arc/MetJ family transcription regulator
LQIADAYTRRLAMPQLVDLDDDIFAYLQSYAEPLTDTPSSVLRRLLKINGTNGTENGSRKQEFNNNGAAAERRDEPRATRSAARSKPNKATGRTRAPSGSLLPEQAYEAPLLRALVAAGGEAPYREITEAVGAELHDTLMPADFENLESGSVRWHSRLQFVRLRLIKRGEMDREAPRGIWRITDAGRAALETVESGARS